MSRSMMKKTSRKNVMMAKRATREANMTIKTNMMIFRTCSPSPFWKRGIASYQELYIYYKKNQKYMSLYKVYGSRLSSIYY